MEKRELGDSGVQVTTVALGSWLTYSGGIGREQTEACTRAAFDAGITLFDTANVYGTGASERAWGEILSDYPRDEYVLATKVYFPMGPRDRGLSRKQILKQIDGSLERLRTDYVDLYQCHRYDDTVPLQETMGALSEVVEAGKARHIGFSEWPAERIQEALDIPGVTKFVSSQPQYSALWRKPEAEVIPLCRGQRHLADRLVAAGAGRADRQVPAGREGAGRLARGEQDDEPLHQAVAQRRRADARSRRCGRSPTRPASRSPSSRSPGCCTSRNITVGDRRRDAARAGAREHQGGRGAARATT